MNNHIDLYRAAELARLANPTPAWKVYALETARLVSITIIMGGIGLFLYGLSHIHIPMVLP